MWTRRFLAYFFSLILVTVVLVYILNLPAFLTQADDLVYEYYVQNALYSFILDTFLVAMYISISMWMIQWMRVSKKDNMAQWLVVVSSTIAISSIFMVYFLNGGSPNTFFSRWFNRVGYKAVVYDAVLVSSVYLLMMTLYSYKI